MINNLLVRTPFECCKTQFERKYDLWPLGIHIKYSSCKQNFVWESKSEQFAIDLVLPLRLVERMARVL